jgi:hypothetical protein
MQTPYEKKKIIKFLYAQVLYFHPSFSFMLYIEEGEPIWSAF